MVELDPRADERGGDLADDALQSRCEHDDRAKLGEVLDPSFDCGLPLFDRQGLIELEHVIRGRRSTCVGLGEC